MDLTLNRENFGAEATIGELLVDGQAQCFTLEDVVREVDGQHVQEWKVPGATAIPRGTYRVVINFSQRFQRELPQVVGVPGFEAIRIHPGNTAHDTEGCILVGLDEVDNRTIGRSRLAFDALFDKLHAAWQRGEPISITVG